ncbi:MAG: hypothetical protein IH991_03795 [Planctomycetes bacterium]|nr:hypothetical protein [Planctomycetota bacterium]
MFKWFKGGSSGLESMRAEFGQMLDAARHIFDAAANALLGGTDLKVIHDDLFETDKRINRAEQKIRREIVIHATVHGPNSFPTCLVLMSVVKDAERLGDYAKNLFELAEVSPKLPAGEHKEDLIQLKDRISRLMANCREAFDTEDADSAGRLISECHEIERHCDRKLAYLLPHSDEIPMSASFALAYRYLKRVTSHTHNVATSIVQPVDLLDFSEKQLPAKGEELKGG